IPPGPSTVIPEPAAVLDLVGFLFYDFAGTAVLDQRSCFTNQVGKKVFGENITITDDVFPTAHGFPLPNEYGEAPMNLVFAGGSTSLDEMIRTTERGVLVTRLWYIREVDPYEKILTGMTRDGTFLVGNGQVGPALRNLRFNQSIKEMLNQVELL